MRKTCAIPPNDFADFLGDIFSSERARFFHFDSSLIDSIPPFSFDELERALRGLANLRASDEDGCVVGLFKDSS